MKTFKPLTVDEVVFTIEVEEEDIPVRGNVMASGDDEADAECEKEIIDRLNNGDNWAWCCIKVVATWNGHSADYYLGACSYANEEEFKAGGYYHDMCNTALDNLNVELSKEYELLSSHTE